MLDSTNALDNLHPEQTQKLYPLLCALCWQRSTADPAQLTEAEIVQIYERGWRYRAVFAEPTEEELAFIRAIAERHGSWLTNYV